MPPEPGRDPRGRLLAVQLLREGLTVRMQVRGNSMWPGLRDGAEVEVAPLREPLRLGDIVLTDVARDGQRLHRLVRRRPGDRLQTRGDGCLRLDLPVPAGAVVGRLQRVRRSGGAWRAFTHVHGSRLLAFVLLGVSWLVLKLSTPVAAAGLRFRD